MSLCSSDPPTQSPTPPLMRSEPIMAKVSINAVEVLFVTIIFALISTIILVYLIIVSSVRFIRFDTCTNMLSKSRKDWSVAFRDLKLIILLLAYLLIFDFYLAIFMPCEFYKNLWILKPRTKDLCRLVKVIQWLI